MGPTADCGGGLNGHVRLTRLTLVLALASCGSNGPAPQAPLGPRQTAVDSTALADVVGWYHAGDLGPVLVTWGADDALTLMAVRDTMLWTRMNPVGPDSFAIRRSAELPPAGIRYLRAEDGAVTGFRWSDGERVRSAQRMAAEAYTPHPVAYTAPDGTPLAATLFVPEGDGPHPGAVMLHGSGTSTRDNVWYMALVDAMASRGIAVLFPDKRGSGASGGDWTTASLHVLAEDALVGVEWLRRYAAVDSAHVGLVGISQGGHVAPMAAAASALVAYVVNISGSAVPLDEQVRHEVTQDLRRSRWPGFLHRPIRSIALGRIRDRHPEWWRLNGAIDPIPSWRALTVPGLVLYGAEDEYDNVPVGRSVERLTALAEPDLAIRVYEGSGHALYAEGTRRIRPEVLELLPVWILSIRRGAAKGAGS